MTKRINTKDIAGVAMAMLLGFALAYLPVSANAAKMDFAPRVLKVPDNNEMTPDRITLGKNLFFDPRLSGSGWISCGTCHNPAMGWSDGLPTAIGEGMKVLGRSTPTIINTAYNAKQMWDGRKRDLEEQAVGPIQADVEMHQDMGQLLDKLNTLTGYVAMFNKAYPGEGITEKTIGKAIASFERTVVSTNAPFDHWVKGDEKAINESAKRGFELFDGKARCSTCHQGFNFVDDGFHNIGLPNTQDLGRYNIVKVEVLKGAFKTPTLRDIALTAPYMHNGAYKTLDDVVDHYNKGGVVTDRIDPNMRPLNLTALEKKDLIEFLRTLTGDESSITIPRLPN
jgi:cytochrome c peroxidase